MAFKIIWSAFAEQQIDEIFIYYKSRAGIKVASKIVKAILRKPNLLLNNHHIGTLEPHLDGRPEQYKYLITTNYKIIYAVDKDKELIKVVDVFDTRQNPIKLDREK